MRSIGRGRSEAAATPLAAPLGSCGQPLPEYLRRDFEPRLGFDFSRVRVHADSVAATSAAALDAHAYTMGSDILFAAGRYAPTTWDGKKLLAHELTHVVQQRQASTIAHGLGGGRPLDHATRDYFEPRFGVDFCKVRIHDATQGQQAAEPNARAFTIGQNIAFAEHSPGTEEGRRLIVHELQPQSTPVVQRQAHGTLSPVSIRSPAFEEAVTQISSVEADLHGRPLGSEELALARSVFRESLDYSRVRLIPTPVLEFRTVGNTIRIPQNFSLGTAWHAETLIHELTHVWQYQHAGTSYISISLASQIIGTMRTGTRNAAYEYELRADASFFDFLPEQQGLIVENYFAMQRDQAASAKDKLSRRFRSNHPDLGMLSWAQREAEIAGELPLHEKWIAQLRSSLPQKEHDLLLQRASEVMVVPGSESIPKERQLAPTKPLIEIRF